MSATARLVLELDAEAYDRFVSDRRAPVVANLSVVEVRQGGGLLSEEHNAVLVEAVSGVVASVEGVAEGGPVIRAFIAPKEDS